MRTVAVPPIFVDVENADDTRTLRLARETRSAGAAEVLDITAIIRRMSVTAGLTLADMAVGLHGKKARQWIGQLEQWAAESSARLDVALMLQKGAQAAQKNVQKRGRNVRRAR